MFVTGSELCLLRTPIFCSQYSIDAQERISYTLTKKQCLINSAGGFNPWVYVTVNRF
jgi:hypothetical protein